MNVNADNPMKVSLHSAVRAESGVLPFTEGERLNVAVIRLMSSRTIVQLSSRQRQGQIITMTVPQMLSPDKVWTARLSGGKPIFAECAANERTDGRANILIDALLGTNDEAGSGHSIINMLGVIFGLNDQNHINMEENRRNCMSFSDEYGHYYFIFRLPTDGVLSKFVIRIDERLNTFINIYAGCEDSSFTKHLTDRMNRLRSSLGTIVSSLNFAVFTDFAAFRTECRTQLGLSGIDIMG